MSTQRKIGQIKGTPLIKMQTSDIKGLDERKTYIESLIAKLTSPNLVVLPELALCGYMGSDEIWKYADIDSEDTSEWAMRIAEKCDTYIAVGYLEKTGLITIIPT